MLYQVGAAPGEIIAQKIKSQENREEFKISEALVLLLKQLKDYYCIQVKEIERGEDKIRLVIENRCFLRETIMNREKLKPGKAFCRIPKGYFETAFKKLIGKKIQNVDINFLKNDEERDLCIEEIIFYLK